MTCQGFGTKVIAPNGKEVIGCDTAYAVFKSEFGSRWEEIHTVNALTNRVEAYKLPYKADVVLTGGEPLLYANDPIFIAFIEYLIGNGHRITFETNGSVCIDFERYPIYKPCTFALSVKLSCSGEPKNKRINNKALDSFALYANDAFFKFTVDALQLEAVQEEIMQIAKLAKKLPIYCMPMSDSKASIEQSCDAVIEFCKQYGYIYSDRLHIRIWDEIQGV